MKSAHFCTGLYGFHNIGQTVGVWARSGIKTGPADQKPASTA